jgi:hypothetical protein
VEALPHCQHHRPYRSPIRGQQRGVASNDDRGTDGCDEHGVGDQPVRHVFGGGDGELRRAQQVYDGAFSPRLDTDGRSLLGDLDVHDRAVVAARTSHTREREQCAIRSHRVRHPFTVDWPVEHAHDLRRTEVGEHGKDRVQLITPNSDQRQVPADARIDLLDDRYPNVAQSLRRPQRDPALRQRVRRGTSTQHAHVMASLREAPRVDLPDHPGTKHQHPHPA